jgi:hypothetical protein
LECDIEDRKAWHKVNEERKVQVRCKCGTFLDVTTVKIVCESCHNEIDEDPVEGGCGGEW